MSSCSLSQNVPAVKTCGQNNADFSSSLPASPKKGGMGFALLPWSGLIRSGGLPQWPDAALAVLPVLAAHENMLRTACPSQKRIARLAGISKSTVAQGMQFLTEQGWVRVFRKEGRRGHYYHMNYEHYRRSSGTSAQYMALHWPLLKSGLWGSMSAATRRVYLVLRAHCCAALNWLPEDADHADTVKPADAAAYLPADEFRPVRIARLAGVSGRTCRKACAWLRGHGFLHAQPARELEYGEMQAGGYLLPFLPAASSASAPCAAPRLCAPRKSSAAGPCAATALQAVHEHAASDTGGEASRPADPASAGPRLPEAARSVPQSSRPPVPAPEGGPHSTQTGPSCSERGPESARSILERIRKENSRTTGTGARACADAGRRARSLPDKKPAPLPESFKYRRWVREIAAAKQQKHTGED